MGLNTKMEWTLETNNNNNKMKYEDFIFNFVYEVEIAGPVISRN